MIRVYKNLQFFKSKFSACKIFREKESVIVDQINESIFSTYNFCHYSIHRVKLLIFFEAT